MTDDDLVYPSEFERISEDARFLAEIIEEPVEIRRTQDGWIIVDHDRLQALADQYLAEEEQEESERRHEKAMRDDPEYRRAVIPASGLSPDPDGDYSPEDWRRSEEGGWFYED